MLYVTLERKPGLLLIGEYGMGKTLLSRSLVAQCPAEQFKFVYISNPRLAILELLTEICYQLGCPCDTSRQLTKVDFLHGIEATLRANFENNLHNVLIFDEAQSIPAQTLLEEVRLLLNIQRDDAILFTLLLIGQPSILKDMETLPQFLQRLGVRYRLQPLEEAQTKEYIRHRVEVAGSRREIFSEAGYHEIHRLSGGIPRAINNICDMALLAGSIKKVKIIDADVIQQVGEDIRDGFEEQSKEAQDNA